MKQIIVIDEMPLFRDYLRYKFSENDIETTVAVNGLDGMSKIRTAHADLIIMDYHLSRPGFLEVLKQKKNDPNTVNTPVIITANQIDQKKIIELVPYNVKKIFTKPVQIDVLFKTISELLQIRFDIDETPSILDVHVNDTIIFIEIAQGLNRDKLDLLSFKILELIDIYDIKIPKIIVMISDLKLSYIDTPNLQKLLDTVMKIPTIRNRNIRILTMDDFVKQFVSSQKMFNDIEVVTNLQYAVDRFMSELESVQSGDKKAEIIGDRLLQAELPAEGESMMLSFQSEKNANMESTKELIQNLRIAVVDDDYLIQELIQNAFNKIGAAVKPFFDGEEFLSSLTTASYDLLFLDMIMPGIDGFTVLKALQEMNITLPVIVLSALTQREMVIKAFQLGVKSYLIKPLKPDEVVKKAIEIIRARY